MHRAIAPLFLLALPLVGCSDDQGFNEASIVATIGEAQLTAGELEALLIQAPAAPTIVQGQAVLSTWLDHAGYIVTTTRGDDLRDEAIRDQVIGPELVRAAILDLATQTRSTRIAPSDAQVDSLAALGTVRVFERFSVPVTNPADSAALDGAIGRLAGIRRAIGTQPPDSFSLAALSPTLFEGVERSTSAALTREELPPAIGAGLWRLEPGMVSDFIAGGGNAQVFVRLPANQAREQYRIWLTERFNLAADQKFVDSLAADAGLRLADDAIVRMRQLSREPLRADDPAPLGSFNGGEITMADARTWIGFMPPAARATIMDGSDSSIAILLTEAGKRAIMQRIAPAPTPEAVAAIQANYAARLDSLEAAAATLAQDGSPTAKAQQWISQVFAGQRPLIPLPGAMSLYLRDRYEATVNFEALEWVVQRAASAWAVKAGTET